MMRDARAERSSQHLAAETDAEIAAAAGDIVADPVDLMLDVGLGRSVIGTLGAAEDDGAGVGARVLGQPLAAGGAAPIDRVTHSLQHGRDPRLAPLAVG